jgi:hypothetical protein
MAAFELYPWHSTRITAAMKPDPAIVKRYIWEPIAELGCPLVFAFGTDWFSLLTDHLALKPVAVLGRGGDPYGSRVASRTVLILEGPNGVHVIAEKRRGSAGPPARDETDLLREAVARVTGSG